MRFHCRYDQLNEKSLRDVALYDRTGRVRSPSPVEDSASEEDKKSLSNEEYTRSEKEVRHTVKDPHVVGSSGEETILSGSSEAEDSDSDFRPGETEGDSPTTIDLSSTDNESTEDEDVFERDKYHLNRSTATEAADRSTPNINASKSEAKQQIDSIPVSASLSTS